MQDMPQTKAGTVSPLRKTVFIVENNVERGYSLAQALRDETSYRIVFATDTLQALHISCVVLPDVVLLASGLLDRDGLALMNYLRACHGSECPSIVLMGTEKPSEENAFFVRLVKEFLC